MEFSRNIIGTCSNMCSEAEIKERERAGLIHFFEKIDEHPTEGEVNTARVPRTGRGRAQNRSQRFNKDAIKADRRKAVKAYTRPAAGVNKTIASDLRPTPVLKKTVAYLCTRILVRSDLPFIEVYDFVFDRLRAVRQDMVIQRINDDSATLILEAIIKFHLYAEFKFRSNSPSNYDPCINQKHLIDCLKTLLSLYQENNYRGSTRPFFEALYCLTSPDSYEVISRAFAIKPEMKNAEVFQDALEICLAFQKRNFYKYFKLLDDLPPLLAAFILQRVPFMRTHALKTISMAYGGQACKLPLEWIEELLCYPSTIRAEQDMVRIGCQVVITETENDQQKFIKFEKTARFVGNISDAVVDNDVKFTVLNGLNNIEVIATEQICPWNAECI